eukprot:GILI01026376.1.p1 GENE.GILI01026376.1~~GILI01026376.1.p1  ORF type:complete len:245 (+),score=53.97 GILI01026376.1:43-777(+)
MPLLEVLFDPFVAFCAICIATPLAIQYSTVTQEDVKDYLLEPSMLFSFGLMALVVLETTFGGKCVKLSASERMRARWYLLNGAIIHILMDGLIGVFKTNSLMAANYKKIDIRYSEPLGNYNGSAVHVISLCELLIKGPICLILYRMYYRGSAHKELFEFFTCVTQMYGTVVYLGQEFVSGCPNLDVDWHLTFSLHHLVYFWFAIAIGCILYFLVPGYLGYQCYKRILRSEKHWLNSHGTKKKLN